MAIISTRSARLILVGSALYFAACGLSALYAPWLWLWSAGLATTVSPELALVFGVLGAYLCTLAVGSVIASIDPHRHNGLVLTLLVGNVLDFITTLQAVAVGSLPMLHGSLFIVVTVLWSAALTVTWIATRRTTLQ